MDNIDRLFNLPYKNLKAAKTIISCQKVAKNYTIEGREDPVQALKNITLSDDSEYYAIKEGEFVVIRGASGGGKTTLLNLLGTIDTPTSGVIKILNEQISSKSPDAFL